MVSFSTLDFFPPLVGAITIQEIKARIYSALLCVIFFLARECRGEFVIIYKYVCGAILSFIFQLIGVYALFSIESCCGN